MIYISFSRDWLRPREVEFLKIKRSIAKFYSQMVIREVVSARESLIKMMIWQTFRCQNPWKIFKNNSNKITFLKWLPVHIVLKQLSILIYRKKMSREKLLIIYLKVAFLIQGSSLNKRRDWDWIVPRTFRDCKVFFRLGIHIRLKIKHKISNLIINLSALK